MVSAGAACSSGKVGPSHVLRGDGGRARARRVDDPGQPRLELVRGRYRSFPAGLDRSLSSPPRLAEEGAQHDAGSRPFAPAARLVPAANAPPIYLDNQSSTRVDPRVLEAMLPYFTEHFGNPHSTSHPYGRIAAEAVERARGEDRRADPRRSARDHLHLGRDRSQQPGDQGRARISPAPTPRMGSPAITS